MQQDVAGDFEQDVADIENAGADAVDRVVELEVGQEMQLGETDVGAVDERHDVAQHQERHQAPQHLVVGGVGGRVAGAEIEVVGARLGTRAKFCNRHVVSDGWFLFLC